MTAPHHFRRHELQRAAHVDRDRVEIAVRDVSRQPEVDNLEAFARRSDAVRASSRLRRRRRRRSGVRVTARVRSVLAASGEGCREHDVLRLQVEVDDPAGVDEVDRSKDLSGKVSTLRFGQFVVGRRNVFEEFAAAKVFGQNHRLLLAFKIVDVFYHKILKKSKFILIN